MVRLRRFLTVLSTAALLTAAAGCDPKLTGTEGDSSDDSDSTPAQVSPEARVVASVMLMHLDAMSAAMSVSSVYDGSGPAPAPRFVTDGCITLNLIDAPARVHSVDFSGCADVNGSTYSGGGEISPLDGEDGYVFEPATSLVATNSESPEFHHSFHSGTLTFTFTRDGSNAVQSVTVGNFLRHLIAEDIVTFSYEGMVFPGTVGQHATWPQNGGILRVVWDGVGIFDVNFEGGALATFALGGLDYDVDLAEGTIAISR